MNNNHNGFNQWWPRVRDILAFALGIFLLTKPSLTDTQAAVGFACLGITASNVVRAILGNGNNRKNGGKQ